MKPKLYDIVKIKSSRPDVGLESGARGAVVTVYDNPRCAYEVEFLDSEGGTITVTTLEESEIDFIPSVASRKKLVIASHNRGKIPEIQALLKPFAVEVISGIDFHLEEPEETGATFDANARIKSQYFTEATKLPSLADDSGLAVPALDGAPGIYSARWAGEKKDFSMAMRRIEDELRAKGLNPQGQPAYFVCVLSLTWPDMVTESFEGRVEGALNFPPRGEKGFGYDPIFIPHGHAITFAEMPPAEKHHMSHRADAFRKLIAASFV